MKFIKVHPDLAVNIRKIETLQVTGREGNAHVVAHMDSGEVYNLSRHESFHDAEISMMDLIERLESDGRGDKAD